MTLIFHITTRKQWEEAKLAGIYQADSLNTEGFIHCSTLSQVATTANRFFRNQTGLVLLCIDLDRLKPTVSFDLVEGHGTFPHVYGALNIDAVSQVIDFEPDRDGLFKLPENLLEN